jgi:tRNA threonylcarbamoyladenosine biosynthesis protein TsaE
MNETLTTKSVEETIEYANRFAGNLKRGDVVALYGDLGSGKTQFVKGVCKAFNVCTQTTSPSFVILNRYYGINSDRSELLIFHFDLYRIGSSNELYDLGYEEFLQSNDICLIEWAERLDKLLPRKRYDVKLALGEKENERIIEINRVEE